MTEKKETRQQAVMRLLGEGKDIKQVAEELGISVRLARSYKWRAENPQKYAAMLKRYFAKRKARLAAEKKAKPKKVKKKPEKPAEAEETVEETLAAEEPKDVTKQNVKPHNPWK